MTNEPTHRKTILVIEDERPLAQAIEAKLIKAGFDVLTARTVDQGLNYIEDIESIDAIWLDHYLSGEKTGLDFVVKLKSPGSPWGHIPIFVVSNTASRDNLRTYTKLWVDKYSVKSDHRLDEITNDIKNFLTPTHE